jgi:gas vesicle protein
MSDDSARHAGGYLVSFAVGALLGAGLALLFAPRSGKETREMLADKGRHLRDKAREASDDVRTYVEDKKAGLAAAVAAGKQAMREEREKHA